MWCRNIQPKFISSDVTCKFSYSQQMSALSLQRRHPCNVTLPVGAYFPFPDVAMAGDLLSASLVVLLLLKRCPCFQQVVDTQQWRLMTWLCRPPCKWSSRLHVLQQRPGPCSSSKVWPNVLIVSLCRGAGTHCCGDMRAGLLETWAQVPAGCNLHVVQPVPSTLLLPSAQAVDEPSLNQLQELHTMLWLLGITSLKSLLAAPQDWAGKNAFIVIVYIIIQANRLVWGPYSLLLLSFTRKSAMEPVPSHPAKTSLSPQEQSSHWAGSCGHLISAPSLALAARWLLHPTAWPREMRQDIFVLAGGKDWRKLDSAQQLPVLLPGI